MITFDVTYDKFNKQNDSFDNYMTVSWGVYSHNGTQNVINSDVIIKELHNLYHENPIEICNILKKKDKYGIVFGSQSKNDLDLVSYFIENIIIKLFYGVKN